MTLILGIATELLTEILSYMHTFPVEDRRNVRLACRKFAAVGRAYLLIAVYVTKDPFDLNTLYTICQDPAMVRWIDRIVVDETSFERDYPDQTEWEMIVDREGYMGIDPQ